MHASIILVDGGMWSGWSLANCSISCGNGKQNKFRYCRYLHPSSNDQCLRNDGTRSMNEQITEICNMKACPGNIYIYIYKYIFLYLLIFPGNILREPKKYGACIAISQPMHFLPPHLI